MKIYAMLIMLISLGLSACNEGPAEEAGENLDNALRDVEFGAQDAGRALEDAGRDIGNAIEDACEEISNRNC